MPATCAIFPPHAPEMHSAWRPSPCPQYTLHGLHPPGVSTRCMASILQTQHALHGLPSAQLPNLAALPVPTSHTLT
eukprot:357220-Chlamydomonas_euryale.AAC.3